MTVAFTRFVVATALVATSLAHAGEPVALDKEEAQKALTGKSITYASSTSGSIVIFFAADGRMTLKVTNNPRSSSGTWSIDDEGRFCIKVTSGTASGGCRHLFKTDTGYALKTGSGEFVPVERLQ